MDKPLLTLKPLRMRSWTDKGRAMHRVRFFLTCLVALLSLGIASIGHATEAAPGAPVTFGSTTTEATTCHAPGDADHVPADSDRGYPHHHGTCHGDHCATPFNPDAVAFRLCIAGAQGVAPAVVHPFATADPALRPPQA
jgi:hypothetical protein